MAKYREDYTDPDTGVTYTDWTLRPRLVALHLNPRMPPDAELPIDPYPLDFNKGAQPVTGTPMSEIPRYTEARVRGNPQIIESLANIVYYPAFAFFNDWLSYIPFLSHERVRFREDSRLIESPCFPPALGSWTNLPGWLNQPGIPTWDKWFYNDSNAGKNKEPASPYYKEEIGVPVNISMCLRDPRFFFNPYLQENLMEGYPNILEAVNAKELDWLLVLGAGNGGSFYGEAAMYGPDETTYPTLSGPWKCQEKHSDVLPDSLAQTIYSYNTGLNHYIFVSMHQSGLRVFDITTLGSVTEKAHFPAVNAKGIYGPYPDTTLYMTDAVSDEGGALYILDISDLDNGNITMKQWLPLEHGNYQHGITKSGNYILEHDGMNLRAVDISDISYTDIPFVTTATGSNTLVTSEDKNICPKLFTFGNYVVVPTINRFETYDISALPTITWKNYFAIQNYYVAGKQTANQIFFVGHAVSGVSQGFYGSVDYTDPLNPSGDGYSSLYPDEKFLGIDVGGGYAYVITESKLRIFPTTTPYTEVGSVDLQNSNSNYAACFYKNYGGSGERLYVISGSGIIDVYNIVSKATPTFVETAYDCTASANVLNINKGYILQRLFASVFGQLSGIFELSWYIPPAAGNFWESFHHWTEWNLGKFWYTHTEDGATSVADPAGVATYGGWQYRQNPTATAYPSGSGFTDWDWFRIVDKEVAALIHNGAVDYADLRISKQGAGCGRPHFPPNTSAMISYSVNDLFELGNYDYGNKRFVETTAPRWLTYPNLSGDMGSFNIDTAIDFFEVFGMSGQEAWEKWWYYHLPHADGLHTDGKHVNNWWEYIFNFQEYISDPADPDYGAYSAAGEIGSPPTFDPALGQQ